MALILINGVELFGWALICCLYSFSLTTAIVSGVILFLINLMLAAAVESLLLDGPLKMFNDLCDLNEFFNITKELLTYNLSDYKRKVMLVNYATALWDVCEAKALLGGVK